MKTLTCSLAFLFCASLAASADTAGDWRRDQAAIETQLQQKQYAAARKASIKLANQMVDRLGANAEAIRLMADTVSLRASAEEGLGNTDDATWYQQVAAALDPPRKALAKKDPDSPVSRAAFSSPADKGPEVIHRQEPVRPGIIAAIGASQVVIKTVIDIDGMVRQPTIVESPGPSASYAALEAVHEWRFHPGTSEGKPVPVIFSLTIRFH
ncbi:MAG TPA: energy transducer TonB [Thermoanaerobaculia bacterium]|nr:energy transducer TonB [Thermoanaerobaculia bacterium]